MEVYKVLCSVILGVNHASTGQTKHYKNGAEVAAPHGLKIVQYPEDSGVYLFYCNANGNELTDTYHDTVDAAKLQAEREFNVKADDWRKG